MSQLESPPSLHDRSFTPCSNAEGTPMSMNLKTRRSRKLQASSRATFNGLVRTLALRGVALAALAFALFGHIATSQARLQPYYILIGQSFAQVKPRVLFVLDTSGSMTWKTVLPDDGCKNDRCENPSQPTSDNSRVYAARKAINAVIAATRAQADFSLMTFGHARPPTTATQVPGRCTDVRYLSNYSLLDSSSRFVWIDYVYGSGSGSGSFKNAFGGTGMWILCGDNRPFPYLRHDNLGFSLPDDQTGPLPAAPLYKSKSNQTTFNNSAANRDRLVQFLPQYLGPRVNLDCADVNQKDILNRSFGDYGTSNSTRETNLCGRDLYYWPYVDGFPDYSYDYGVGPFYFEHVECGDDDYCYAYSNDYYQRLGTMRRTASESASLLAPFFSQAVLDNGTIGAADKGPLSETSGDDGVFYLTAPMNEGGVDASGGTPWLSAVGDVDTFVTVAGTTITPKAALIKKNAAFSHSSVASYLSFMVTNSSNDLCVPQVAVMVTDGEPSPWSTEGGATLYSRLNKLRKKLGVKTYIVGFNPSLGIGTSFQRLQGMACAAAGSNSTSDSPNDAPCYSANAYNWDTCRTPGSPTTACAWQANNPAELEAALVSIVQGAIDSPVPAGPDATVNEFLPDPLDPKKTIIAQTGVSGYTETPSWKGHVVRGACSTGDTFCLNAATAPDTQGDLEPYDGGGTLGGKTGCGLSRNWDAGECLKNKLWSKRRIYSSTAANVVYRISDDTGKATAQFRTELQSMGLLTAGQEVAQSDAIAAFVLGKDWPGGWKLPGLANSSPIVTRRIPKPDPKFLPQVGIRDAHCAGRLLEAGADVSPSLVTFANDSWNLNWVNASANYAKHRAYQEAVLIGTDLGLLHAFHFDSGNEMFAYLPRQLLPHVKTLTDNGVTNFGQPNAVDLHEYGIATTVNQIYAYDHGASKWRHVAVFGYGAGGREIVALDITHMGNLDSGTPFDVLWTTESASTKASYDAWLGETWSRPALTYTVENDDMGQLPRAWLVFGSGYKVAGGTSEGRAIVFTDLMTGQSTLAKGITPAPAAAEMYGPTTDYGLVGDPAVGTHCLSRYWGEMQEVYMADVAGRLYRWDMGATTSATTFPHTSDSGSKWSSTGDNAIPLATFDSCVGTGASCNVSAGNKNDYFVYAPAVISNNRIDEIGSPPTPLDASDKDQFLVALISGTPYDDAIDGGVVGSDFHSSLYIVVDDHRVTKNAGLNVGAGGLTPPGASATFMRLALTQINRTRTVTYPNGTTGTTTKPFARGTRPIRAPRIEVTGAYDLVTKQIVPNIEVFYITFTVYEPGEKSCDPKWYDAANKKWVFDQGSTYEIRFRLTTNAEGSFNLINGSGYAGFGGNYGDGFGGGAGAGLTGASVSQVLSGACSDGNCGPSLATSSSKPCDPNPPGAGGTAPVSVPMAWSELDGYSPLEIP